MNKLLARFHGDSFLSRAGRFALVLPLLTSACLSCAPAMQSSSQDSSVVSTQDPTYPEHRKIAKKFLKVAQALRSKGEISERIQKAFKELYKTVDENLYSFEGPTRGKFMLVAYYTEQMLRAVSKWHNVTPPENRYGEDEFEVDWNKPTYITELSIFLHSLSTSRRAGRCVHSLPVLRFPEPFVRDSPYSELMDAVILVYAMTKPEYMQKFVSDIFVQLQSSMPTNTFTPPFSKPIILHFWSEHEDSHDQMPELEVVHKSGKAQVIAIHAPEYKYVRKCKTTSSDGGCVYYELGPYPPQKVSYPVLHSPVKYPSLDRGITEEQLHCFPDLLVIDRDGSVVFQFQGVMSWQNLGKLLDLLREIR